jgi:hypothetical protein
MTKYTNPENAAFEAYSRQFGDSYKVQLGKEGIWEILCQNGDIEPYSMSELCCYQAYKSARGVNNLKNHLPNYCTITQDGGWEIVFKFPNARLDEVADVVHTIKCRKLSPEQKARNIARLRTFRFQKATQPTVGAAWELAGSAVGGTDGVTSWCFS